MATPFETFVNTELPKRLATNVSPTAPQAGEVPVFTGVGLLTENKSLAAAGIQAALANVITAGTYGNTTQYPVLTFNAKGICTGVTLQTVDKTLTETTFAVEKTGASAIKVTWILTALTAARAWTIPDKAINLGDLPSVATTNNNVLSGTRTFCVMGGGSSASLGNKIQGTDTGAIGSTGCDMRGTRNIAYSSTNVGTAATATDNSFYNCFSPLPAELVTTIGVRYINCVYSQLKAIPIGYGGTWPNYSTVEGVNQFGATKCTTGLTSINFNRFALSPLTTAGSGSTEVLAYCGNLGYGITTHDITITCNNYNDVDGAVFRRTVVINGVGTIVSTTTPVADVTYGSTVYTLAISIVGRVLRITVASSISSNSGAFANVVSLYQ